MKRIAGGLLSIAALIVFLVMAMSGTLKFLDEADGDFFID